MMKLNRVNGESFFHDMMASTGACTYLRYIGRATGRMDCLPRRA